MTSLRASLPPAGSVNWSRRISRADEDPASLELKVRHVVIRDVVLRQLPKPHMMYKVDVMTQSDQWSVYRRYSHFEAFHYEMVKARAAKKDALPKKRMLGNMNPEAVEQRRQGLERYMQRLISGNEDVLLSEPLIAFLEVKKHNVIGVTLRLTKHLSQCGEQILGEDLPFHLTATQCRCVAQRLLLPYNFGVEDRGDSKLGSGMSLAGTETDLAHLYEFVYQLKHLCVHPKREDNVAPSEAIIERTEADLSCWRSVEKLEIDHSVFGHFLGLASLQDRLTHFRMRFGEVKKMQAVLYDAVVEKRAAPAPKAHTSVDIWRQAALVQFAEDRIKIRPWVRLISLDLGCNEIREIDMQCLELLPLIQNLSLNNNFISSLQGWLRSGHVLKHLTKLDLSGNMISSLKAARVGGTGASRARTGSSSRGGGDTQSSASAKPQGVQSAASSRTTSPARAVSQPPNRRSTIDPSWVSGSLRLGIDRSVSDGPSSTTNGAALLAPRVPTTLNTAPPSYNSNHLISTNHPRANLDELQRIRMAAMNQKQWQSSSTTAGSINAPSDPDGMTEGSEAAAVDTGDVSLSTVETIPARSADEAPGVGVTASAGDASAQLLESKVAANGDATLTQQVPTGAGHDVGSHGAQALPVLEGVASTSKAADAAGAAPAVSTVIEAETIMVPLSSILPQLVELNLANNRLTNLRGLERMSKMEVLDVSSNALKDYGSIGALLSAPKLKVLSVQRNPLAAKKDFRQQCAARILTNAAGSQLVIDGKEVVAKEVLKIQSI